MTYKPTLLFLLTLLLCTTARQQSPPGSSTHQQHAAAKKRARELRHAGTKKNDAVYSPSSQQALSASRPHIDTTFLIVSDSQINRVLKELQPHSSALSPEIKTILSTLAGALLTLLTQLFIFSLGKRKENNKSRLELLAEERRLSDLLTGLYNELAWLRVSKDFWYRSYIIRDENEDYTQFSSFRDRISQCKGKITETTSEYAKTVTHFMHLTKNSTAIHPLLENLRQASYLDLQSADFAQITDLDTLQAASEKEVVRLKTEYTGMTAILNDIHEQMKNGLTA